MAVAKIGKLLAHRLLDEQYAELREHHVVYMAAEQERARCKTEMHHALKAIFPDLNLSREKKALFGPGGIRMMELFHGNPDWIISSGDFESFVAKIRADKTRVQTATLRKIWEAAQASHTQQVSPIVRAAQANRIAHLASDLSTWTRRLETIEDKMELAYRCLKSQDARLPDRQLGCIVLCVDFVDVTKGLALDG
ncbi:MAG: hypothetical protein R3C53_28755 [Pirellulaceae bacterium]